MSSVSTSTSSDSLITTVDLGKGPLHGSLFSHALFLSLEDSLKKKEKVILFYNRRGSGRAWICEDCSYFPICPRCDIALAYHTSPRKQLVCHHCSYREEVAFSCPSCQGHHFHSIGIGLQKVASDLESFFPEATIVRVDSDVERNTLERDIQEADIVLTTHTHVTLMESEYIQVGVFLLFESDLTFPDYRMEEDLYHTISYAKKSKKPLLLQTYIPDHPLLQILIEGNYRDFLRETSRERKTYTYPPYAEFIQIRIHGESQDRVRDMLYKLVNKIEQFKSEDIFLAYDKELFEKYRDEWVQKIILKGSHLDTILETLEGEIVRNRSVSLEYR